MRRNVIVIGILVLASGVVFAGPRPAETVGPEDYMLEVTTEWVTPHVPWAKPYARGKPKVLFFCTKIAAPREVVELNERLPMDFEVITTYSTVLLGADPNATPPADRFTAGTQEDIVEGNRITGMRPAEKEKEVMSRLKEDWEAVVFGQFRIGALPEAARKILLKKVRAGMGLVLAYDGGFPEGWEKELEPVEGEERLHFTGLPLREIPGLRINFDERFGPNAEKLIRLYRLGEGRVVVLDYGTFSELSSWGGYHVGLNSLTPRVERREAVYDVDWERTVDDTMPTLYEYSLMLVARALLWTIPEKTPSVTLLEEPGSIIFHQSELPKSITFRIECRELPLEVEVRSTYRRPWGEVIAGGKTSKSIRTGHEKVKVPVPVLPAGKNFLEVQLASASGVEAWWAVPVTVEAGLRIEEIRLDKEIYSVGDEVAIEVEVSKSAPEVEAQLKGFDVHDREILHQSLGKVESELLKGRFTLPPTKGTMVRLEVSLNSPDAKLLSSERKELRVSQVLSRLADFPFIVWGTQLKGYLQMLMFRQLRSLGFDATHTWDIDAALADSSYGDMATVNNHGLPLEYYDKDAEGGEYARFSANKASRLKNFNMLAYSLAEELNMNRGKCLDAGTEQELKLYSSFLREKYGTIEDLNRAWGTSYGSFDEVPVAMTVGEARSTGNYPAIIERWRFLERLWANYFGEAVRGIREVDPRGVAGVSAIGNEAPHMWADYRLFGKAVTVWAPYSGTIVEKCLLQSLVPRSVLRGNWWGGYLFLRYEPMNRFRLWDKLVHGHNSLWVYRVDGVDGILGGDLTPALHYRLLEEDLRQIKGGIGQLVANSEWRPDPVAVYWSRASTLARAVAQGVTKKFSKTMEVHSLFHALDDAGFCPRFVDQEDLKGLNPAKMRVLILADVQCLSEEEGLALEAYVREGGTLLADVPPGSCTELGRAREKPLLDELFGIRRSEDVPKGVVKPEPASVKIEASFLGKPLRLFQPETMGPVDSAVVRGISAKEGTEVLSEANGVPVFLTRAVGKGRVILLNFTYDNYLKRIKSKGWGDPFYTRYGQDCLTKRPIAWKNGAQFWNDLFGALGVEPGVKVIGADLKHVVGVRRGLFSNGKQRTVILACLGSLGGTPDERVPYLPAGEAMLVLPSRSHVVDLRENKYLGFLDRVPLVVGAGKGFAFSILPEAPGKIQLDLPEKVKAGQAFTIAAQVPDSGEEVNVIRFVTTGPDGKPCPWFSGRAITKGAEVGLDVVAGWNDPEGVYRVEATDVASGSHVTGTFEIIR